MRKFQFNNLQNLHSISESMFQFLGFNQSEEKNQDETPGTEENVKYNKIVSI